MNLKYKLVALCAALALITVGAVVPAYAGNRHHNDSDENEETEMFEFDDENNGESYSWEGKPITIKFPENWNVNDEEWSLPWSNHEEHEEDEEEDRGGYDDEEGSDEEDEDSDQSEFDIDLSGDEEVPGPGDGQGEGWANVRLLSDESLVCVDIEVSGINLPATDAHIHKAAVGQSGPVVLALPIPNEEGDAYGCVKATSAQLTEMMDNPELFYVNVHSSDYPDGAVRGQLVYSDSEEEED